MRQGMRHLREYLRFVRLPFEQRRFVVYSEGPAYWPHLEPTVCALLARDDTEVAYVSSIETDPGIALKHPRLNSFVIGDGHVRTLFFGLLKADVVLMTMPDLDTFHIKRSVSTRHYAYLHHSLVSSHMVYREHAFDAFDSILCAGPHHEREMRAQERLYGLKAKQLVPHGYGRLDAILAGARDDERRPDPPMVLVAPSWGPNGLLEGHADALLRVLAGTGWEVVVRPHPQTWRLAPEAIECVRLWCERSPSVTLETSVAGHGSLQRASVMISDWSGAAFDYALGLERPVLFVDVPRKVNNPRYGELGIEPLEVFGRGHIGEVVGVEALDDMPRLLRQLMRDEARYRQSICDFRDCWVHNPGKSGEAAAGWLAGLAAELRTRQGI